MIYTDGTPTIASMGVSAPCKRCASWNCKCGEEVVADIAAMLEQLGIPLKEEDNEPREYGIRDSEA